MNPIDWYNAKFQVYFKLVKYADGTGITAGVNGTTTNGHTFIREIQVECNVITISNNTKVNGSSNVLSKSYAELVESYMIGSYHETEFCTHKVGF